MQLSVTLLKLSLPNILKSSNIIEVKFKDKYTLLTDEQNLKIHLLLECEKKCYL